MRPQGGVWFAEGIHVSGEEGFSAPRRAHPALRVDDIDALAERLAAAGCPVDWDKRWPGVRRFYTRAGAGVSDANGYETPAARTAGDLVKREVRASYSQPRQASTLLRPGRD